MNQPKPQMTFMEFTQALTEAGKNVDTFEAYLEGEIVTSRAMQSEAPDDSNRYAHFIESLALERVLRQYRRMKA